PSLHDALPIYLVERHLDPARAPVLANLAEHPAREGAVRVMPLQLALEPHAADPAEVVPHARRVEPRHDAPGTRGIGERPRLPGWQAELLREHFPHGVEVAHLTRSERDAEALPGHREGHAVAVEDRAPGGGHVEIHAVLRL